MIQERLSALRNEMRAAGLDATIIPTADYHASEYLGEYFKTRKYMTGFTGSAGTLVVTPEWAGLWTDGRYFIQAAAQLEGTGIELMRMGMEGVPDVAQKLGGSPRAFQSQGVFARRASVRPPQRRQARRRARADGQARRGRAHHHHA